MAPKPAEPSNRFTHAGRRYLLYKRPETGSESWYVRVQVGRKRYQKSLETSVKTVAIARAKRFLDKVRGGRWKDAEPVGIAGASTLGQVIALYEKSALIAERSVRNNVLAMLQVIGPGKRPGSFPLEMLTGDLVREYQSDTVRRYVETAGNGEATRREARERALRSSRSTVCQARSLFTRRLDLVRKYTEAGVIIPDCVNDFMTCRLEGRAVKRDYHVPPDKVIDSTFRQLDSLRSVDPNAWLAFWFAVGAGLRRQEIQHLCWEHLAEREDKTWISGGIGKDGERIEVPMQSRAVKAITPLRKRKGRVLSETGLEWAKRLNYWMRSQGWETEKKLHELRAYVGSLIYRESPVAAMRFMRHKSIRITEQFYIRYGTGQAPVDVL